MSVEFYILCQAHLKLKCYGNRHASSELHYPVDTALDGDVMHTGALWI